MNRIKQLREEFNFSQNDLAQKLGGAPSSIAMYEKEERKPSLEVLIKLSEIFNCSIDYLLCKTDIRNPEKINIDDVNVAFSSGIKGLNDTNKAIVKSTIEALLAKQEKDEEDKKDKK